MRYCEYCLTWRSAQAFVSALRGSYWANVINIAQMDPFLGSLRIRLEFGARELNHFGQTHHRLRSIASR